MWRSTTCNLSILVGCLFLACLANVDDCSSQDNNNGAGRLNTPTRALAEPETITKLPASTNRPVLIYYANESAPDEAEKRNTSTLVEWLKSAELPVVRQLGWRLEYHSALMPFVVDCEIVKLVELVGGPDEAGFDLVVITNRLARRGRFIYLIDGGGQTIASGNLKLPRFEDSTASSYPLSQEEAFDAVLKAVANVFDPKSHEFVLVTKSHGSPEHALTTSTSVQTSHVGREKILDALTNSFRRKEAAFAKISRPILTGGAPLPSDADGNCLMIGSGLGYWESHGPVYLRTLDKIVIVDAFGSPFRTADGDRLVVDRGFLTSETGGRLITYDDGSPVMVAGVASPDGRMMFWDWRRPAELPEGRQAVSQRDLAKKLVWAQSSVPNLEKFGGSDDLPLTQSAADVRRLNDQAITKAGDIRGKLVLADPRFGRLVQAASQGDGRPRARQVLVIAGGELPPRVTSLTASIVEGSESINELVAVLAARRRPVLSLAQLTASQDGATKSESKVVGTQLDPILEKMGGDPILEKMGGDPILEKMGTDPILEKMGTDPILNKDTDLAADVDAPKLIGTTKDQYWAVVKRHADAGMIFRLVFVEACRSELSASQLQVLRATGTPVERIWSSDSHGLDFQTIDYDSLGRRITAGEGAVQAFDAELRRRYDDQHPQ